ncbi:MAG: 3-oxoacyl-[acyl-carrier protein] reductase, partial [uncultured Actinomycetospora sp.]
GQPAQRGHRHRPHRGGVGRGHRHRPQGSVARDARGDPRDDRARWRADRQHLVARRAARAAQPRVLLSGQGRRRGADPAGGVRVRPAQRARQRDRAGDHRHPDPGRHHPRDAAGECRRSHGPPARTAGGDRIDGGLLLPRGRVPHGVDLPGRRRMVGEGQLL